MVMKFRYLFFAAFAVLLSSCKHQVKFPKFVTEKVERENVKIMGDLPRENSFQTESVVDKNESLPESLLQYQQQYAKRSETFDMNSFQQEWQNFKVQKDITDLDEQNLKNWFDVTGFLFQLTGDEMFAAELERIVWLSFEGIAADVPDSVFEPFIFTKNVDHIHLNLFLPAEISYDHTLGGHVKIVQETSFPQSGSVRLNFSMEIKRYIEVFVRIPTWAEGATVTVKGVKYFTQPGEYCIIAKKWKEGDVVEIEFPLNNLPDYLKKLV
jgi:hypothetical protein